MIEIFNKLKLDLLSIYPDIEKQKALYAFDLIENYERHVDYFKRATLLLSKTIEDNDSLAIRYALVIVRIAALNLSDDYRDIMDDVILVNEDPSWPSIPEDYKLPDVYNNYLVKK